MHLIIINDILQASQSKFWLYYLTLGILITGINLDSS